ncbi:MAG: SUMF1/EgtB/PvdO family nonheme iron enzyme [Saprospirales bacterium]|nr:SUMF1/EgtB/PvdO family nonheme iron enzyme [Saprospirales bacterium]
MCWKSDRYVEIYPFEYTASHHMSAYDHPLVFINYRRAVTPDAANLLDAKLSGRYGEQAVFRDNRTLEAGCRWEATLETAIGNCAVLLVLIGKGWLECQYGKDCDAANGEKRGRLRLENPDDYVRREIEWALERQEKTGKPLILPVFFDGEEPCRKTDYPENSRLPELAAIQSRFAIDTKKNIPEQLAPLFDLLEKKVPELRPQAAAPKPKNEYVELLEHHFPLPGDIRNNPPASAAPYMELNWFKEHDARLFFGRSREIYEVCQAVHNKPTRVLLLHGLSGVGKSSLLDAGLRPRLRHPGKGWTVLHGSRRDQPGQGLPAVLNLLEQQGKNAAGPLLLLIDQAEEAITNPLDPAAAAESAATELAAFSEQLHRFLRENPAAKAILGFRKEYLPEIKNALKEAGLYRDFGANAGIDEYFLQPLGRAGILEAIHGASLDDDLRKNHFLNFSFQPGDLPETIAADIARDKGSNIAPLLQVQMLDLWKAALAASNPPVLSETLLDQTRHKNLEQFLENQLAKLPGKFRDDNWLGLALDMLHFFSTDKGTAASHTPEEIAAEYGHQPEYPALLRALAKLYLLIDNSHDPHQPYARLTHDALGPIVRAKFERREYPAQRAWFVTRSKSSGFSEADAELANAARPYLRRTDATIWTQIETEMQALEQARARERADRDFIFRSLFDEFKARIEQTDYAEALQSFQAAFKHAPEQHALLAPGIEDALFFLTEAGNPELARVALQALEQARPEQEEAVRFILQNRAADCPATRRELEQLYRADYAERLARLYPEMVPVKGGRFTMGDGKFDDAPEHPVRVGDFKIARTLVTVRQWALFCACAPDAPKLREYHPYWGLHADHPVVSVSWYNAADYLNWLSLARGKTPAYSIDKDNKDPNNLQQQDGQKFTVRRIPGADGFRLPSEAEWEFAAKGGLKGLKDNFEFSGSNNLGEVGWYKENSEGRTWPVAHPDKRPNQLGLYDLSGNAWEWCWDWFDENYYPASPKENPQGPEKGQFRVLRGGSWFNTVVFARAAVRNWNVPVTWFYSVGLRVAQD